MQLDKPISFELTRLNKEKDFFLKNMLPYRSLFKGAMSLKENGDDLSLKLPQKHRNSPQKKKKNHVIITVACYTKCEKKIYSFRCIYYFATMKWYAINS